MFLNQKLSLAISYTDKEGNEKLLSVGSVELSFANARRACKIKGGDLASIEDAEEEQFVVNNVLPDHDHYWIGATDEAVEGQFEWVDG